MIHNEKHALPFNFAGNAYNMTERSRFLSYASKSILGLITDLKLNTVSARFKVYRHVEFGILRSLVNREVTEMKQT